MKTRVTALIGAVAVVVGLSACGGSSPSSEAQDQAKNNAENFRPYVPPANNTEQQNYNAAQKLYNDPANILWCTVLSQSSTGPIITVPIAGKLTSSTTTAFQPEYLKTGDSSGAALPAVSVDGLYHPSPPPYRYGFTPGGQYVDFFNTPTVCTTKPLEFQRQSVSVKVDSSLNSATAKAEAALRSGNKDEAQRILESAAGN